MLPGVEPVGSQSQLLGNHRRGLAAGEPVLDGFTFEGFIEFTTGLDGYLCHGLVRLLFTQSSVRQFEATSSSISWRRGCPARDLRTVFRCAPGNASSTNLFADWKAAV